MKPTLYPLLSSYDAGLDYLLLDEALTQGLIEVVEMSKDGAVPELRVINNGRLMVLILDGEELVGAKPLKSKVTAFLAHCVAADPEGRPSMGLGTDWRVENGKVAGLALTLEGALLHLSLFNRTDGPGKGARFSRMARFAERRGQH